jgi:transposase
VWSEEKQKKDEQTFDRKIQKETAHAEKELKKLMSRRFACVPDASQCESE